MLKHSSLLEDFTELWLSIRRHKVPRYLFLLLCLNLIVAPAVYGATNGVLSRNQAYAIALLELGTVALSIYLFVVIFQPERF
jgi:K+-transporting ATPase KdpF subunit